MYDSRKRRRYILSLSMISLTHITYSFWVPNDDLPGFDDRLFVSDLYFSSYLGSHLGIQFIVAVFNWRTSFQREWILEAHSHRFVALY